MDLELGKGKEASNGSTESGGPGGLKYERETPSRSCSSFLAYTLSAPYGTTSGSRRHSVPLASGKEVVSPSLLA